jgi:hypothetical protein
MLPRTLLAAALGLSFAACGAPAATPSPATPSPAAAPSGEPVDTGSIKISHDPSEAKATSDATAGDFSLKERDYFTRIEHVLQQSGKALTVKCLEGPDTRPGAAGAITFDLDKPTWKGHVVQDKSHSESENNDALQGEDLARCQAAEMALKVVCGTPEGKKAVGAKVQKIVCAYSDAAEPSMSLSGGTLRLELNGKKVRGQGDIETLTKTYLGKTL